MAVDIDVEAFYQDIGSPKNWGGKPPIPLDDPKQDPDGSRRRAVAELLELVTEHINRYAPTAPPAACNRAAVRFGSWVFFSPIGPGGRVPPGGGDQVDFARVAGAFRSSGAMALLNPWRIRRAR